MMESVRFTSTVFVLSSLSVLLFFSIRLLNKLWFTPIHVQRLLRQQGIKGTSYKFLHGDTKEVLHMKKESMARPMEHLSHDIFPRLEPHFHSWRLIYGKNFLTWYGSQADLIVTEVELIKEVFNRDQDYPKNDMVEGFVKVLLGNGLVTAKGKKWAKQRKLANQVFHSDSLKSMTPSMVASVEMMLDKWKQHEGKEINVFEEFKFLTSEVISRTAFGSSFEEGKDIFNMLTEMAFLITRNGHRVRIPGLSWLLKSKDDIRSEKLEKGMHDSIMRIMNKRKTESSVSGVENFGNDFLGSLMKAVNNSDKDNRITIQDAIDECKTFYVAGQETTSTLLTWVVFLLAIHTDWQEKARQEILNLFGKEYPHSDGIARLKILNMIINETLRLYSPVTNVIRKVSKKDSKLGKYRLPANVHILVSILAVHRDKNIWGADALQFNPERFSQGVAKATNNNSAVFLPFGLGPRSCVGLNFATNETKIALAMILQRYSFTLSPTYIHSPVQILTVRPQHGMQIMLHPL